MSITSTPRRRRFGVVSIVVGIVVLALSTLAAPASAEAGDPVFGAGYDSYLNENQRGAGSGDVENPTDCPSDAKVEGMTSWHFVLSKTTHDFASLDVAFTVDDTDFTMLGLTPKTTSIVDWATFDPDLHFIADPDGKHAYVYTDGAGGVVRDAAAQDSPDSAGPKFQLSHVCLGEGGDDTDGYDTDGTDTTDTDGTDTTDTDGTDTTTTDTDGTDTTDTDGTDTTTTDTDGTDTTTTDTDGTDTTTTDTDGTDTTTTDTDGTDTTTTDTDGTDTTTTDTGDVGADTTGGSDSATTGTTGTAGTTGAVENTDTQVAGEVVSPNQLPATGAEDRSLTLVGVGLIALGAASLVTKRVFN